LFLWAWRANFGLPPAPPPAQNLNPVFVEVTGVVTHPGVYSFDHPPTLPEVWQKAGGGTPAPDKAVKLASGSRVEISKGGVYQLGRMNGRQLLTLGLAIDLNQATQNDLEALPGIGPVIAGRIIDYRQKHGPFKRIDDLEQVSGIGPKKLAQIKPYLLINETDGLN
jgi:competence protein ComEA